MNSRLRQIPQLCMYSRNAGADQGELMGLPSFGYTPEA